MDLRISYVERFKYLLPPISPWKITSKSIELILVFAIVGIIPLMPKKKKKKKKKKYIQIKKKKKKKNSFTWKDLVIWSWPLLTIGGLKCPWNHPKYVFF